MSERKLILYFSRLKDAELSPKAENIVNSMTGNPNFPEPNPALAAVQENIDAYNAALAKATSNGGKADTLDKDQKRKILQTSLAQLGSYVENTAEGNEVVMAGSGFDLSKVKSKVGALQKPENFKSEPASNKGTMQLSVKKVVNADFYEFQFSEFPVNGGGWQTRTTQKRNLIVEGLTSGKQYIFRVAGAGSDASRIWSDEITSYVL